MSWSRLRVAVPAVAALIAAGACGSDGEPGPSDAGDTPLTCDPNVGAGEPITLRVGSSPNQQEFAEIVDGGVLPVLRGAQGFWMLPLQLRASLELAEQEFCFPCTFALDSSALQVSTSEEIVLSSQDDTMRGFFTFLLGSVDTIDREELDGIPAQLSIECDGSGFTGTVDFALELAVAE
jgi:hypothetical protein